MKIIEWSKKNYLIVILFIVSIWVLMIKININIKDNKINDTQIITPAIENKLEDKTNDLISPTPTIINDNEFGNKTKEEILQMDPENRYDFITDLSREEVERLDMMPNYDFSDFLPYKGKTFIAEKYSSQERTLTVSKLTDNKEKSLIEINNWLFYENGNNPKTIKIIWNE